MDDPVLVLNANYEPLNVCSTRRAIGLMMMGKATMLENGRGTISRRRAPSPARRLCGCHTWSTARVRA